MAIHGNIWHSVVTVAVVPAAASTAVKRPRRFSFYVVGFK